MFYSIDTHVLNWPKSPFPKDKKKTKKTKRQKDKKTKDKYQKESITLRRQGSFAHLRCFVYGEPSCGQIIQNRIDFSIDFG